MNFFKKLVYWLTLVGPISEVIIGTVNGIKAAFASVKYENEVANFEEANRRPLVSSLDFAGSLKEYQNYEAKKENDAKFESKFKD